MKEIVENTKNCVKDMSWNYQHVIWSSDEDSSDNVHDFSLECKREKQTRTFQLKHLFSIIVYSTFSWMPWVRRVSYHRRNIIKFNAFAAILMDGKRKTVQLSLCSGSLIIDERCGRKKSIFHEGQRTFYSLIFHRDAFQRCLKCVTFTSFVSISL